MTEKRTPAAERRREPRRIACPSAGGRG